MSAKEQKPKRIVVLIDGGAADGAVVEIASLLGREHGAALFFVRTVVIERSLPLDAPLPEASARARAVLERAQRAASQHGCQGEVRELRTRDAAAALIDEAADLGSDLIVLGIAGEQRGPSSPLAIAEQVARLAPCPVLVYRANPLR